MLQDTLRAARYHNRPPQQQHQTVLSDSLDVCAFSLRGPAVEGLHGPYFSPDVSRAALDSEPTAVPDHFRDKERSPRSDSFVPLSSDA